MAAQSTFRVDLRSLINTMVANWGITLSKSQMEAMLGHIQQLIITDSATVIANCTADLLTWPEPSHGRHT